MRSIQTFLFSFFNKLFELLAASLKLSDLIFHFIVLDYLPESFLIDVSIKESQCYASISETTSSSDTMEIVLVVRDEVASIRFLNGDIEVYDKLDRLHVETAGEEVGGNDDLDLTLAELLDVFVSFFFGHPAENDVDLVPCIFKDSV